MDEDWVLTPVAQSGAAANTSEVGKALTAAASQDALGNGRAALRQAAKALEAIAKKYDLHGYAII